MHYPGKTHHSFTFIVSSFTEAFFLRVFSPGEPFLVKWGFQEIVLQGSATAGPSDFMTAAVVYSDKSDKSVASVTHTKKEKKAVTWWRGEFGTLCLSKPFSNSCTQEDIWCLEVLWSLFRYRCTQICWFIVADTNWNKWIFVKWSYFKCGDIVSHTLDLLT